jgi:hypothetical protein
MVYISEKQVKAMDMIGKLIDEFKENRWFTKSELPGITKHTIDALWDKGYLSRKTVYGVVYHRRLKELGDES